MKTYARKLGLWKDIWQETGFVKIIRRKLRHRPHQVGLEQGNWHQDGQGSQVHQVPSLRVQPHFRGKANCFFI